MKDYPGIMDWFPSASKALDAIYPSIRVISGSSTDPEIIADGKKVLLFCSPNYLGLANHPDIKRVSKDAIDLYGAGTVGSGIISGYTDVHEEVERRIARFMEYESSIFFNSTSSTSAGVITSVIRPPLLPLLRHAIPRGSLGETAVFYDEQNHASLYDAISLSRPDGEYKYRHCDVEELEKLLKRSNHKRKLIVTDGYFSMSARVAPLQEIVRLAKEYEAMIMVDDAHGVGVLGDNGRGTAEMFGVESDIHFPVGSTAKAFGIRGGFVCGSKEYIKYLRVSARAYMFSGTLPAPIPAGVIKALEVAENEPWRREKVLESAQYLRIKLTEMGYTVLGEKHIVPVLIGDESLAHQLSLELEKRGIFASSIRYPAVPKGEAQVRFMPMATHTQENLDLLLEACQCAI